MYGRPFLTNDFLLDMKTAAQVKYVTSLVYFQKALQKMVVTHTMGEGELWKHHSQLKPWVSEKASPTLNENFLTHYSCEPIEDCWFWVQQSGFWTGSTISFSIDLDFCLQLNGIFFLCGSSTYLCLPANWTGTCTLVFLIRKVCIVPTNQSLPIPLITFTKAKRAIQLVPLLMGLGVAAGISTGLGGFAYSSLFS